MNVVALIGNVASEVEPNPRSPITPSCTFTLAVGRHDEQDRVDFVNLTMSGPRAQIALDYITVGRRIAIEGRVIQLASAPEQRRYAIDVQRLTLLNNPGRR